MKIKFLSLFLIMTMIVAGGVTFAFAGDTGTLINSTTVEVNESGNVTDYNFTCIDKNQYIYYGETKPISKNITTREGVIDYITNNYDNTSSTVLQDGVWNITQNTSIPFKTYPDFYSTQKKISSPKIITVEEINGKVYIVSKWTEETYNFVFRMMGDGWDKGSQDLLLFKVTYLVDDLVNYLLVPPIEPEPPIVINNTTNPTINDTQQIDNIKEIHKEQPVKMLKTGNSFVAVIVVLIVIFITGIVIYNKKR